MTPRRVLITGAAGNLGAKLAAALAGRFELICMDCVTAAGVITADLSVWNESWTRHFMGADAVVHLAGNPIAYHGWDELLAPNVDAMLNVFEAAARHGVGRVIFASSNHVMGGYHDDTGPITTTMPPRPGLQYSVDGAPRRSDAYGACKLFGERVGAHYAAARGLEVIAVRLGWNWRGQNTPDGLPSSRGPWFRAMWLSDGDFLVLMERCLVAPLSEPFVIVHGMSANSNMRWDLTTTRETLGYAPSDDVNA